MICDMRCEALCGELSGGRRDQRTAADAHSDALAPLGEGRGRSDTTTATFCDNAIRTRTLGLASLCAASSLNGSERSDILTETIQTESSEIVYIRRPMES